MGISSVSGLLTFVLLGALATVGALAWLLKELRNPGPLEADKVVMIVREDDGGSIADQLERAGVIDSAMWFNVLTLLDGNRGALKRGEYEFKAGVSMNELENELIAHRVVHVQADHPGGPDQRTDCPAAAGQRRLGWRRQGDPARGVADARYLLL